MNSAQTIAIRLLIPAVIICIAPEVNATPQTDHAIVRVIVDCTTDQAEERRFPIQSGTSFDHVARKRVFDFRMAPRPRLQDPSAIMSIMEFQDTSILQCA